MAENAIIINGKKRRQRVEVFAVNKDDMILVAEKGYTAYPELPGGGVDIGESLVSAGMRELAEEAGWLAIDPKVMELPDQYIFSGKDDGWFNRDNWNEEENIAIVCTAIRFEPTKAYGSEDDHLQFTLIPIKKLIKNIEEFLLSDCTERKKVNATFRLAILKKILLDNSEQIKNSPTWTSWSK